MDRSDRWRTAGLAAALAGLFAAGPAAGVSRLAVATLGALVAWAWYARRRR